MEGAIISFFFVYKSVLTEGPEGLLAEIITQRRGGRGGLALGREGQEIFSAVSA